MSKSRSFRRALALTLAAVTVASACGGGGDKKADATTTSAKAATTTSAAATTTTVPASTTTTAPATTTTVAPGPTFPLTGLPADDAARLNRPAMVVKVNNVASARPQHGINQADIVFEEKIGTSVTRFLTVFQSQDSDQIGSIRSARASDLPILGALSKPLFAWSGANEILTPVVRDADVTDIGYSRNSGLYARGRRLPDYTEFFISTENGYSLAPAGQGAPAPIFAYRSATDPAPTGSTPAGVRWTKNGYVVDWAWDSTKKAWLRNQQGTPHVDADGVQVAPENVVFMFTQYRRAFDDPRSPESVSLGTGPAWVLTNGVVVPGTWTHGQDKDPFTFTDQGGNPIKLTPGRTWVELAEPDSGELLS